MRHHQPGIVLVARAILTAVTLLASATVFVVMERHGEAPMNTSLQLPLQSSVKLAEAEIELASNKTVFISTRPLLINLLQDVDAGVDGVIPSFLTVVQL